MGLTGERFHVSRRKKLLMFGDTQDAIGGNKFPIPLGTSTRSWKIVKENQCIGRMVVQRMVI